MPSSERANITALYAWMEAGRWEASFLLMFSRGELCFLECWSIVEAIVFKHNLI